MLGCLVEKERTTPEQYPLTTNALRNACNQKSNRDPVVDYLERTVDQAMLALRERKFARTVVGGGRAAKHKHVLDEALGLDDAEIALLAVLALRGPQTPGELRGRTERLHAFDTPDDVVAVLERLADRPEPLAVLLARRPGQKEARWAHLLEGEEAVPTEGSWADADRAPSPRGEVAAPPGGREAMAGAVPLDRVEELESEVAALRDELESLRDRVDHLVDQLGVADG